MGKIIGIDLGTTNSCVAVMEGNEPVVITNSEGKRTTPSVIGFVDGGERKVGDPAKRQAITNPTRTVYSIKRFMGETYDRLTSEVARVPYKVVKGDNNTPRVDIDGRLYTPQEISAIILQKMKKTAEDYLGQEVTYFYQQDHRSNTKKLISFAAEDNKIVTLTESSIDAVSSNTVEYLSDENGKIRKLYYNVETDIVYNGGRDAVNLKEKLENLSGTARFIDNDADGRMDVIIIDDYRYDAIHSTDLADETIYFGGVNINLEEADACIIENETGGILTFNDLAVGDVIAIAKSERGNIVRLVRLSSIVTGKAVEMGKGTITVGETSYKVSTAADAESLAKVKLGSEYSFHLNQIYFCNSSLNNSMHKSLILRILLFSKSFCFFILSPPYFTKLLYSTRMAALKSRLSTPKMMFSSSGPWLIMRILMPASPRAAKILPEIPGR